jgi:hypothetical protein
LDLHILLLMVFYDKYELFVQKTQSFISTLDLLAGGCCKECLKLSVCCWCNLLKQTNEIKSIGSWLWRYTQTPIYLAIIFNSVEDAVRLLDFESGVSMAKSSLFSMWLVLSFEDHKISSKTKTKRKRNICSES